MEPTATVMPPAHIRLYKHEIKQLLDPHFIEESGIFDPEYAARVVPLLNSSLEEEAKEDAKEEIWRLLTEEYVEHTHILEKLLQTRRSDIYEEYTMKDCHEVSKKKFIEKFYHKHEEPVVEYICSFLRANKLALDLRKRFGQTYHPVVERILEIWTPGMSERELDHLARQAIRWLPTNEDTAASGDWFCHLLMVLRDSEWHSVLADILDPDNASTIDMYLAKQKKKQISENVGSAMDDMYEEDEEDVKLRPQSDFSGYAPVFRTREIPPPLEISLRPYQEELVENAITGKNTIICAPTGAGKTVVASYVILDHLNKMRSQNQPARVAMLVPTIPLVEQQCIALYVYFRVNYVINGFCGTEVAECRAYSALAADIVVFTPQLLLNMLKSPKKNDRLNVADFSMFVFDECHHCDGEHPYKLLMDMVQASSAPPPHIIGLTASLGVGSGGAIVDSCINHMLKICVNLSAEAVSTVRRSKDDLNKYVVPPLDIIERAVRQSDSQFIRRVHALMGELQELLEGDLKRYQANRQLPGKWVEYQFPSDKNSLSYQNFLGTLGARVTAVPEIPNKTRFLKVLEILKKYQLALECNDMLPVRYANKLLEYSRYEIGRAATDETYAVVKAFGEHCDQLHMIQEDQCEENKDILVKLRKIIVDQYTEFPESRTLIFVQKRAFAEMMCEYLNEMCAQLSCFKKGKNVGYITSANQSAYLGGQSGYIQRQTIENFNHGIIQILVATSVAEEGLDISTCNLIIKYNNTGSEKTLIQRRGRARAKGSKSVLLALDGSIEANEMAAVQKEDLMKRVMEHLQSYGSSVLGRMIDEKREQMQREQERTQEHRRQIEQQLKANKFELVCIKCGSILCDSTSIRRLPHGQYGSVDRDIWSKVVISMRGKPKSTYGSVEVAEICCKTRGCDQKFGIIREVNDTFLPILKINSFLLYNFEMRRQNQSCDPIRVKRWVDAEKNYFIVYDCRQIDLKNMFGAMRSFDEPLYKQLTNAAEYARTYLARKEIDKKKRRYDQRENMKPKNNESDEELVVMEELNENNESDEELVVMEELDSDDELCYSIFL